jgi:hypothetical protein
VIIARSALDADRRRAPNYPMTPPPGDARNAVVDLDLTDDERANGSPGRAGLAVLTP